MQREILFRGKGVNGEGWIEGYYWSFDIGMPPFIRVIYNGEPCDYEVIPETVGQYTGLKDCNGVKIFEGDKFNSQVLLSPDGISSAHNINYWINSIHEILFMDGKFISKWTTNNVSIGDSVIGCRTGYDEICLKKIQVISNIHDTPELLKS